MAERYQWTQGPHNGQIETVNCEDDNFVYFDSGRRCAKQKLGYMMFQTTDSEEQNFFGNSLNTFEDEIKYGTTHDYGGDLGITVDIPDEFKDEVIKTETPQNIETTKTVELQPQIIATVPEVSAKEESPVAKLLNMQKQDSLIVTAEPIHINLRWPTKQFIEILLNTFDRELVINELSNYMEKQINIDSLKDTLKFTISTEVNKLCNSND
jgi:hypothetical protein